MVPDRLGRHISFMKGLLALYLIFLVIFFAAAPFLTLWLYAEANLTKSLLPQLIGFCLQGAFLVVVFAIYEKRSSFAAKRGRKVALRISIASLTRPMDGFDRGSTKGILSSPVGMDKIRQEIQERGISEDLAHELAANSKMVMVSLESLTVLAAQIDADHLESWGMIIYHCRRLAEAASPQETAETMLALLDTVRDFDELYVF